MPELRRATDRLAEPMGADQYVPAAFDRFWIGHLWIGVTLGQVAAVFLLVYFVLTQDGPQQWLLVGLTAAGLAFNIGVAVSRRSSARRGPGWSCSRSGWSA